MFSETAEKERCFQKLQRRKDVFRNYREGKMFSETAEKLRCFQKQIQFRFGTF
jgi:hypothetical protein